MPVLGVTSAACLHRQPHMARLLAEQRIIGRNALTAGLLLGGRHALRKFSVLLSLRQQQTDVGLNRLTAAGYF